MKKLFAITLALMLLLSLTACGQKEAPKSEEGTVGGASTVNPVRELDSLEALSKEAQCALVCPTGVEISDESFAMIKSDTDIAQYKFSANGKPCCLRFSKAGMETDISGIYLDGGTLFADSDSENHWIQNDNYMAQRWFTVDGQYILSVENSQDEWDWAGFNEIYTQFYDLKPLTWNAKVAYEDYKAMTGTYSNEAGDASASLSIRLDHLLVTVFCYPENADHYYYEMDASLKDGKLVYDKESVSVQVVHEDGSMDLEELEPSGAGSIEILSDGALDFSGAASEGLKGLVLKK